MATIDEIISTSQARADTAMALLNGYATAVGGIVGSYRYVVPPDVIGFSDASSQFSKADAIKAPKILETKPLLASRSETLAAADGVADDLRSQATGADPGAFVQDVWVIPPAYVPEPFAEQPQGLDLPPVPDFAVPTLPVASTLNPVSSELSPSLAVQTSAALLESPLPDAPEITLQSFDLPAPVVDFSAPSNNFAFVEEAYSSSLCAAVRAALENDILAGGYGINPSDEQALWERARDREAAGYRDSAGQIAASFAARGFPLAPDSLAFMQQMAHDKMLSALGDINREIALKRSDLYVQARQFALQQGANFEAVLLQVHGQRMERALNAGRAMAEFALRFHDAMREQFILRRETWQAVATVSFQQVDSAVRGLEAWKAKFLKIDAEESRNKNRLEAWQLANQAVQAMEGVRQTQLGQAKAQLDFEELKLRYSAQLTANFLAQHNANETAFSAYRTLVEAQAARNEPLKLSLDVYRGKLEAAKLYGDISKDRYDAGLAAHRENQGRRGALMQNYLAALAYALDKTRLLAEGGNQDALALQKLLLEQADAGNRADLAAADLKIKEFIGRWSQYVAHMSAAQDGQVKHDQVGVDAARAALSAMEGVLSSAQNMLVGVASDITQG